ncbi:MAG TPA: TrbI/VirB10 family protein [Sphingomicrobium sp.]|nr:TrbI/VirB10 family protein [Sphingomicrobium sp.]
MTDSLNPADLPQRKENPKALALRGRPRPAVRFRRGLIVGVTGAFAAGLITLSWLALEPPGLRKAATPIDSDEPTHKAGPDALANVPGSYGDVPRLGPPLPGDLGRPILEQQRSLGSGSQPIGSSDQAEQLTIEAERERIAAARQAARSSPVLVQLGEGRNAGAAPAMQAAPAEAVTAGGEPAASAAPVPASQQRKIEFARSSEGDQNPHELRAAPSTCTLSAGTIIPATLITGLDSDLPGTVLAQVSENVRDSATGRTTLIPQGARLIGRYDSVVAYGQRRALLVWTRIVFPDGGSIELDNMPATDVTGYAGLEDRVDSHTWQLLKGIGLSTLLGVSTQLSIGGGGDLVRAIRESTQQNAAHAGDQITSRNLDVQPTIKIRPGWPVRVLVNKDLVLQPWRG